MSAPAGRRCAVDGCGLVALRSGGYCPSHQNQYEGKGVTVSTGSGHVALSAIPPQPSPTSDPAKTTSICHGHACGGQIKDGYCHRHAYLSSVDGGEPTSPRSPLSPGPIIDGASASLAELSLSSSTAAAPASVPRERKERAGSLYRPAPSLVAYSASQKKGKETLERFLAAVHSISQEIEPHKAAEKIIQETCRLLEGERATLYYVEQDELHLVVSKGAKNIRLPKSRGVAGHVATTGETLNIPDAHADARFDSSFDLASGFRTRNILAAPVVDSEGEIIAVLQCINKQRGQFTREDEILIQNIALHCSVTLRNAELYESAKQAESKVVSLLELIEMLHSEPDINSLIFTLSHRAHALVTADRSTLYLCDRDRNQLVVMQGDVDLRVPLNKGIAGFVAQTGEIVNISDCYEDERFDRSVDKKTGYRTKQMLCMPIFGSFGPQAASGSPGGTGAPPSPVPPSPGGTIPTIPSSSSTSSPTPPLSSPVLVSPPAGAPKEEKLWPKGRTSLSSHGEVVGVIQFINRLDETDFTREDERLLATFLKIAGPLLKRQKIFGRGKSTGTGLSVTLATANSNNTEASIGLASSPGSKPKGSPAVKPRMVAPVLKGISEND